MLPRSVARATFCGVLNCTAWLLGYILTVFDFYAVIVVGKELFMAGFRLGACSH